MVNCLRVIHFCAYPLTLSLHTGSASVCPEMERSPAGLYLASAFFNY